MRESLVANQSYILPVHAIQLCWQSPTGSSLQASIDGINFSVIGTSVANEVKQIYIAGKFIKTSSSDTIIVAK